MTTQENRIAALERDAATMKRDIIYKLDDTNSAVTMIRGIVGNQGQDIKDTLNQVKVVNVRLEAIDTRLEGLKEEIRAAKRQQDKQERDGEEIKRHQDKQGRDIEEVKERLSSVELRLDSMDQKFDKMLQLLTGITNKLGTE